MFGNVGLEERKNLYPIEWLALSDTVRNALAKEFGLTRSSPVHVIDNVVETDGYTVNDLKGISIEKMQAFTGSSSEKFYELITLSITKLTPDVTEEKADVQEEKPSDETSEIEGAVSVGVKETRGRKKTQKDSTGKVASTT